MANKQGLPEFAATLGARESSELVDLIQKYESGDLLESKSISDEVGILKEGSSYKAYNRRVQPPVETYCRNQEQLAFLRVFLIARQRALCDKMTYKQFLEKEQEDAKTTWQNAKY